MIFKLAIKEIVRNPRLILFFILNLSLGLGSFVSLQSFNQSIQKELNANQKNILTAAAVVSARRKISESQVARVQKAMTSNVRLTHGDESFALLIIVMTLVGTPFL